MKDTLTVATIAAITMGLVLFIPDKSVWNPIAIGSCIAVAYFVGQLSETEL